MLLRAEMALQPPARFPKVMQRTRGAKAAWRPFPRQRVGLHVFTVSASSHAPVGVESDLKVIDQAAPANGRSGSNGDAPITRRRSLSCHPYALAGSAVFILADVGGGAGS